MKFSVFLLLPALAMAGQYSGVVKSLDGKGLAGATVLLGSTSTVTGAQGNWSLSGVTGVGAKSRQTAEISQHLVVEKGHVVLNWMGADIQGRRSALSGLSAFPVKAVAARSAGLDTILVQWQGKNLYRVPVAKDSSGIVLVLDTAWSDDRGIPWNPAIAYGSVAQADRIYRTVAIKSQRWMAENLNFAGPSGTTGRCYGNKVDNCARYGRLYTWAEVMAEAASSLTSPSGVQGLCPVGWHVPSDVEWTDMRKLVDASGTVDGTKLKSADIWGSYGKGSDDYGFRALPGGYVAGANFGSIIGNGFWWTATEKTATRAWYVGMNGKSFQIDPYPMDLAKSDGLSLRCVKD